MICVVIDILKMECQGCNEEVDLAINYEGFKLCKTCVIAGKIVQNDVVFFLFRNFKSSPCDDVLERAVLEFCDEEICKASTYLLDMTRGKLNAIDTNVVIDCGRNRRNTKYKTKSWSMLNNIASMLTALGDQINVYPLDISRIPIVCQDVSSMSLESRLDKAESGLASQNVTIDNLRVDIEFLKNKLLIWQLSLSG